MPVTNADVARQYFRDVVCGLEYCLPACSVAVMSPLSTPQQCTTSTSFIATSSQVRFRWPRVIPPLQFLLLPSGGRALAGRGRMACSDDRGEVLTSTHTPEPRSCFCPQDCASARLALCCCLMLRVRCPSAFLHNLSLSFPLWFFQTPLFPPLPSRFDLSPLSHAS